MTCDTLAPGPSGWLCQPTGPMTRTLWVKLSLLVQVTVAPGAMRMALGSKRYDLAIEMRVVSAGAPPGAPAAAAAHPARSTAATTENTSSRLMTAAPDAQ